MRKTNHVHGEDKQLARMYGDGPTSVCPALQSFISQLESARWSNQSARTQGLRSLAMAKLETEMTAVVSEQQFSQVLCNALNTFLLPKMLRSVALVQHKDDKDRLLEAAGRCETEGTAAVVEEAATAAYNAPTSAARHAGNAALAALDASLMTLDETNPIYIVKRVGDALNAATQAMCHGEPDLVLSAFADKVAQSLFLILRKYNACHR